MTFNWAFLKFMEPAKKGTNEAFSVKLGALWPQKSADYKEIVKKLLITFSEDYFAESFQTKNEFQSSLTRTFVQMMEEKNS